MTREGPRGHGPGGFDVLVEVVNGPQTNAFPPLADSGTGNGLRGLNERVSACGGSLEAGPQ